MKILMVCLGNICRSPVAEGIMKSKFLKYGIAGEIDSAGLLSMHVGENPDKRATASANINGIDISKQITRQIRKSDFKEFDLIFTMDHSIQSEVLALSDKEEEKSKVHLLLDYSGIKLQREVPDPYFGDDSGFTNVFRLVDEACEKIAIKIKSSTSI